MRKVLQATISSAEFISIRTSTKFNISVRYIHENKSWERCYVILKIIFPCLRVLRLADSNISGMERVYYYSRMIKQYIEKTISDIDYQRLLPDILSPNNIWNESDDKSDEEESISKYCTFYSDSIFFVVSSFFNEREKHSNTDYAVTGWILYVITHIRKYFFKNGQNNHHIHFNNVINTFCTGSTEKELHETLDTFCSKYTNFNIKNDHFDSNEFIQNSKYISGDNIHIWNQKYFLPSTKVIGFVAYRVTSKYFGIGSAERS